MKKISRVIISSMTLGILLFNLYKAGYGECLYNRYKMNELNNAEYMIDIFDFKNNHNESNGYMAKYNEELTVLYTNIKRGGESEDADTAFLYDTIIYNTFIVEISEGINEYSHDSHAKKIAKNIIKTMDESVMRSGILFEILREIPDGNIQGKKQYEDECHEFSLSKVKEMSRAQGTDEDTFLHAVKCHHDCIIKMSESIMNLTTRKEVKEIAQNLIKSCNKRLELLNKVR